MCGTAREPASKKLRRLAPYPVVVRRDNKDLSIADEEVPEHCPALIERKFLPEDLADRLLNWLVGNCDDWSRHTWTVHGKTHVTSRKTRNYSLVDDGDDLHFEAIVEGSRISRAPSVMDEAATLVCEYIKRVVKRDWKPTFAFANRYQGGQECVHYHSDFLMALGPRPVIVGLSLGARRTFRLRSNDGKTTVSLPALHNSLIVMNADAQENWQHGVLRTADVGLHPVARDVRFSLTFRMERPEVAEQCGVECRCKRPATLKCSKSNGQYYLSCNPAGGTAEDKCGFWQKCPWAQREADRLRALEQREENRPPLPKKVA